MRKRLKRIVAGIATGRRVERLRGQRGDVAYNPFTRGIIRSSLPATSRSKRFAGLRHLIEQHRGRFVHGESVGQLHGT